MPKYTGKCLCGAIQYEINGEIGPIYNCHCSRCRRWHGAAYRTRAPVKTEDFRWVSGKEFLSEYAENDNTKTFCSKCGSSLISYYKNHSAVIGLPLGGLEQDPGRRVEGHIFVGSKAPWHEITDDLPQYEEWTDTIEQVRTGQQ